LFNLPIDAITIQDIEQFLQSGARENTVLELKEQFPSKLEKVISSMANTSGGMILIGVEETTTGGGIVPIKGLPLVSGHRERVIEIGLNAIYPPLIPEVRVVDFKTDQSLITPDKAVVVIRVNESDEGHAVDQRTALYVRADNVSDRMRKATVEETEWFFDKRQKSLEAKSRAIQQAQQHAQQFLVRLRTRHQRPTSEPKGRFLIWTVPTFPRIPIATPKELYQLTQKQILHDPVFGIFPSGMPHRIFEGIYWGHDESSKYFYTEIHQQGLIYNEFEFWWDEGADNVFVPQSAAIMLRLAVKFASNLYRSVGYFGPFDIGMRLAGVRDRHIHPTMFVKPRMMDDVIEFTARMSATLSEDELRSKLKDMMRDVYWAFGWDVDAQRLDEDFK
jgi:Schlafen, AlbA_2